MLSARNFYMEGIVMKGGLRWFEVGSRAFLLSMLLTAAGCAAGGATEGPSGVGAEDAEVSAWLTSARGSAVTEGEAAQAA